MKKNKALFILLGVLLVLLIVYFALQSWNRQQEEKESEDEAVVVTEMVNGHLKSRMEYGSIRQMQIFR